MRLDGTPYDVVGRAVLDHGRGKWPYAITWNWAAGFPGGGGSAVGITLGGKWTDGTGSTENGLFVDGFCTRSATSWSGSTTAPTGCGRGGSTGRVSTSGSSRSTTAPTAPSSASSPTRPTQCFGHFSGWASTDDGERVDLDGLVGWAEEACNRW